MKTIEIDLMEISPLIRQCKWAFADENFYIPWRIIYDFEFIFVLKGEICVEQEGKEPYTITDFDFHIMQPMVWHRRYVKRGKSCEYYNIHFDFMKKEEDINFSVIDAYIKTMYNYKGGKPFEPIYSFDEKITTQPLLLSRNVYTVKNFELPNLIK